MLHFIIKVNADVIGTVYIQRLNGGPGEWCLYNVIVEQPPGVVTTVEMSHHYDDGALVLIRKAIEAAELERVRPYRQR